MSTKDVFHETYYRSPIEFLINYSIEEWDIEKANISILRDAGYLDDTQYLNFKNMDKNKREVTIGCLIRDNPEVGDILKQGISNARLQFYSINTIDREQILYVDNDSITIIKPKTHIRNNMQKIVPISEHVRFRLKGLYTSYYRLGPLDMLYYSDQAYENYRIKYGNHDKLGLQHGEWFLNLLLSAFHSAEVDHVADTLRMINYAYRRYIALDFASEYYREFNLTSKYRVFSTEFGSIYYTDFINPSDKPYLDISYNAELIRKLYKIYSKSYFETLNTNKY